mmetsp:Transcript_17141/g.36772  ORF Transcript_17141/g.36772 Transcript_17141/m.36772 type:complete len:321 (-) Transcript_17141:617-1579(-)
MERASERHRLCVLSDAVRLHPVEQPPRRGELPRVDARGQQRVVCGRVRLEVEALELCPGGEGAVEVAHERRRLDDGVYRRQRHLLAGVLHLLERVVRLINQRWLLRERSSEDVVRRVPDGFAVARESRGHAEGVDDPVRLHHRHHHADAVKLLDRHIELLGHLVNGEHLSQVPLVRGVVEQLRDELLRLLLRVERHHALQAAHLPLAVAHLEEVVHHPLVALQVGRAPLLLHCDEHAVRALGVLLGEARVDVAVVGEARRHDSLFAHVLEDGLGARVVLGECVGRHERVVAAQIGRNALLFHLFEERRRALCIALSLERL